MDKDDRRQQGSPVRSMVEGPEYEFWPDLAAARNHPDAAMIMEGDWGGTIYLTAPVSVVRCGETALLRLLARLDGEIWAEPDGARLLFERRPPGSRIAGGMGGGEVIDGIWLNPLLESPGLWEEVEQVILRAPAQD